MSVALRCPVCGTTQGNPGECDACSEGQVRYFCDNHNPGRWLDGPTCTACGATFGDAPRKRPEPRTTVEPIPTTRAGQSRTPSPRGSERSRRDVGRPLPTPADPDETRSRASLADVLARMLAARERARYEEEETGRRWPIEEPPRRSIPILGCLVRLVIIVFLFIAFALGGLYVLLGG